MRKGENDVFDDEGAIRLLEPLRGEPGARIGIDVPRAMSEGLRRRRLRRWSSGMAALALTSITIGGGTLAVSASRDDTPEPRPNPTATTGPPVTATAAPGPTSCTVTRLPTAGVKKAVVTAGDPSGRYTAGRLYSAKGHPAKLIVWKDGAIDKQVAMPGADAQITDMTRTGTGIANGFGAGDHESAYLYDGGHFTRLRGNDVTAAAVNEAGVIAGVMGGAIDAVPVRWASATAAPVELPLPAKATLGGVSDLDEDGTVVGAAGPDLRSLNGYLWLPDGTGRYLPLPTTRDGRKATSFAPSSISNGWVAGNAIVETKDSTTFTPMRYRIATGRYEMLPAGLGRGDLVSAEGWVVGAGQPLTLVAGARTVRLPAYGAGGEKPGDVSYDVRNISADGHLITGYKAGPELGNDPLMWTCR